jgi:L-fucose isomerase-like protein
VESVNDFLYSAVASSLHDHAAIDRIVEPVRAILDVHGGRAVADPASDPTVPHLILVATGGTEQAILELVTLRHRAVPHEPVLLVAHPLHNSLPAALEAMARLRADGYRGRIVQSGSATDLADAIGELRAVHRLRDTRLGLVGEPSEWLVASVPDRRGLLDRWGIELVEVDIGDTIKHHRTLAPDAARPVAVRFAGRAEPTPDLVTAAGLHPVLAATIEREHVDAVAVRCFDYLTELETSGCIALAELNDSGVVAGCEGDVASTVAMMLVRALFDVPSWIANPAVVDPDTNRLLLAHCTVAPSMVEYLELHTHFESGLGVGLRGSFEPGWVTLLRLGGSSLERHWFAEAELLESGASPDLCRTQVTLRVADQDVGAILHDPLGNHLVMVLGRRRDRLERWWRLAFG